MTEAGARVAHALPYDRATVGAIPMPGKPARDKGAAGEREVVSLLRQVGWPKAERRYDQAANGGSDIAHGPEGTCIEVKRARRAVAVPAAMRQAEAAAGPHDIPIVLHRVDREPWRATLPADELLALLRLREA